MPTGADAEMVLMPVRPEVDPGRLFIGRSALAGAVAVADLAGRLLDVGL